MIERFPRRSGSIHSDVPVKPLCPKAVGPRKRPHAAPPARATARDRPVTRRASPEVVQREGPAEAHAVVADDEVDERTLLEGPLRLADQQHCRNRGQPSQLGAGIAADEEHVRYIGGVQPRPVAWRGLLTMVGSWAAEKRLFRPGLFPGVSTTGNWLDVSHYTQMIWPTTTRVGCAVYRTRHWDYLICRYSPPGNIDGRRAY